MKFLKKLIYWLTPRIKPEWHGEYGIIWLDYQWLNWFHPTKWYDTKFPLEWWIGFFRYERPSCITYRITFLGFTKSFCSFK